MIPSSHEIRNAKTFHERDIVGMRKEEIDVETKKKEVEKREKISVSKVIHAISYHLLNESKKIF